MKLNFKPKQQKGRPPLHGKTMKRYSVYLTAEQKAWLDEQSGNASETIRSIINAKIEEAKQKPLA